MKRRVQVEATVSELRHWGATAIEVTNTTKHGRVTFSHGGKEQFVTVGLNASGPSASEAARQAVRHQLGIVRVPVRGKRRKRKHYANRPAPTAPESITILPDPWSAMRRTDLGQRASAFAADQAWARLFGLCLLNADHVPTHPAIRHAIGLSA